MAHLPDMLNSVMEYNVKEAIIRGSNVVESMKQTKNEITDG